MLCLMQVTLFLFDNINTAQMAFTTYTQREISSSLYSYEWFFYVSMRFLQLLDVILENAYNNAFKYINVDSLRAAIKRNVA